MRSVLLLVVLGCVIISGCAMNSEERIAELERKVMALEERSNSIISSIDMLDQKQAAIENLYTELATKKSEQVSAAPMSNEEIQTALKNSGFYSGSVDGKLGPNTQNAIKEFQKANGLKADGVVGPRTRSLLAKYLGKTTD